MRFKWAGVVLLLACVARGQDAAPLILKGQFDLVKVTRFVPVIEEREAIKAFPCTVEAPANAIRPVWTVPAGVSWSAKGRVLTITAAPKGEITITAEWSVIDFEKKTITDQIGSKTFLIGDAPQPPPTPSPLQKVLQVAYDVETDPAKAVHVVKFAAILEGSVAAAKLGGRVKTASEFIASTKQATDLAIGPASISGIRKSVANYLDTVLPREPGTLANDVYFAKVASEFGYVALALRGLK